MKAALTEIVLYPVKSLRGVSVKFAEVEPWGLRHDRRWLVLNPDGTVLTARRERRMLGLSAAPLENGSISLTSPGGSSIQVEVPSAAAPIPLLLSRLDSVRPAALEASAWLSAQLRREVTLGWLDDPGRRTVSITHGGRPGDTLNLADAGPLLLTSSASLRQLNTWIVLDSSEEGTAPPNEISMRRFRPNVVVQGEIPPFIEDTWTTVQVGGVQFRVGEPCDRCVMTTVDPETLLGGKQPLRTLARHRQWNHKTWFGVRMIPEKVGPIMVGDDVTGC
jgi:uncharacterized protein